MIFAFKWKNSQLSVDKYYSDQNSEPTTSTEKSYNMVELVMGINESQGIMGDSLWSAFNFLILSPALSDLASSGV